MKTPDDGCQSLQPSRIHNPLARWLSFFAPEKLHSTQDEPSPIPIAALTDEKHRPLDRENLESDSDCACE